MRIFRYAVHAIACLMLTVVVVAATIAKDPNDFMDYTVRKGESISLICIDIYGYYSPKLGSAIQKDNPDIKNVNLIFVGQKMKLRSPRNPGASASVSPSPEAATPKSASPAKPQSPEDPPAAKMPDETDSLFVKKIQATQGVVTCVEGGAFLTQSGKQKRTLAVNALVYPGDILETAKDGRVELIINRESVVRLRENTRMVVEVFRDANKGQSKTQVGFRVGTLWTKVKKFKDRVLRFELELPMAIAGVHGTVYQTTVNPDSSSEVKVFSGEVAVSGIPESGGVSESGLSEVSGPDEVAGPQEVSMEAWVKIVKSMQVVKIGKDGKASDPESFTSNRKDSWEQWNEERDKRISDMFMEN